MGEAQCSAKHGGSYNQSTNSCQCGNVESCLVNVTTAPVCDNQAGICKCSENVTACLNPGETCIGGQCMCGVTKSCGGNSTAPFCDAENGICKCSMNRSACTTEGERCKDGECRCGDIESCENSSTAPYCDINNSTCRCSEKTDACQINEEVCLDGHCRKIGEFYFGMQIFNQTRAIRNMIIINSKWRNNNISVHGSWGAWAGYGTCSRTCAGGLQYRYRACNSPSPSNGGNDCMGSSSQSSSCNSHSCCANK